MNAIGADFYVAPDGSDSNPGTSISSPFRTVQKGVKALSPGDQLFLRGGAHVMTESPIVITKSGTSSAQIHVYSYPGELPVLRFDDVESSSNRGIVLDGDHWHWRGITIERAGDNGMLLSGNESLAACGPTAGSVRDLWGRSDARRARLPPPRTLSVVAMGRGRVA